MRDPRTTLALLGAPCGGTMYLSRALTAAGLPCGHESWRHPAAPDGDAQAISCGFLAWDEVAPRRHRHVMRSIRDPLKSSETLWACLPSGRQHRIPRHPDQRIAALRHWVLTHERISLWRPEHTIRVGHRNMADDWARALDILGLPLSPLPTYGQNAKNGRGLRLPPITWDEWRDADPEYADRGRALCERQGVI